MAAISLVTAGSLNVVESLIQATLPAGVAVAAGQAVILDPTTGKWALSGASTALKKRIYGIATRTVPAGGSLTAIRKGVIDGFALTAAYDADIVLSATDGALEDAAVAANAAQTVTVNGSPTGGTFTLTLSGQTTAAIAYNAAASAVQTALEALSTVLPGNVRVTGSAGGPYTVTFVNSKAAQPIATMTADGASLTGGTNPAVAVAVAAAGVYSVVIGRVIPSQGPTLGTAMDKLLFIDL